MVYCRRSYRVLHILACLAIFAPEALLGQLTIKPTFSPTRGFYESTIQVTLASSTPEAEIRYTTTGATPSSSSGTLYTGPITISTTTPLRAVAYSPGLGTSEVVTHTYVNIVDVLQQTDNPPGYPDSFADSDNNFHVSYLGSLTCMFFP